MKYKHNFKRFRIDVPDTKQRWVVFEAEANKAVAKAYEQGRHDAILEARNAEAWGNLLKGRNDNDFL